MPVKLPRLPLPLRLVLPSVVSTVVIVGLLSECYFHQRKKAAGELILPLQQERATRIAEQMATRFDILEAIALDRARAARGGIAPETLAEQPALFNALEGAKIQIRSPNEQRLAPKPAATPIWEETQANAIALRQPLYNPAGQLQGEIALNYSLFALNRLLQPLPIGANGRIWILNRALQPVASSHPAPLPKAVAQQIQQQFGAIEAIQGPQQLPLNLDGQKHWTSILPFARSNSPRWWIVILTSEADFLAAAYSSRRSFILLSLALAAATCAAAYIWARRLARPLQRLREATTEIAKGHWQQRVELNRTDELGDLAQSFNAMAEQLQAAFAQLQALNQTVLDSENRLLQFLEVLPVGVSVHDRSGKPLYFNQMARDLLQVDPDSLETTAQLLETCSIGQAGTAQLYPLEEFPIARSLQGERCNLEDLELRRNGRTIPLEMWSTPIVAPQGEVAYALAAFLDISARKQAELVLLDYNRSLEQRVEERTAALARAEAELKGLFAAMQEVIFVLDRLGRYHKVVSKHSELLARAETALLQQSLHDVFAAEQAEYFLQVVAEVIESQQTSNIDYSLEIQGRTLWFEASISPFSEDLVVWVARDVSDRQVLEDKVRTSEAKMRAIFEAMPDIILTIDARQEIEVSPTNLSSPQAANLLDLTIEQFWSEENDDLWFSRVREVRQEGKVLNFDYALGVEGQAGRVVWFSAQIAPLPNDSAIWIARDISDRKAAEAAILEAKEAAEAANRAKSTFVANMSHELRSPLNAILGFAQLLARSPDLPPQRREYASIINRSGEHLLALIDQVLNLSKIEAGRAQLNETDFDLHQLLEDLKDLFALKAEEKGLELHLERAANVPHYIRSDRLKLRQILINLLGNSLKFTARGRVTLSVAALDSPSNPGPTVRFEVEDTGPGIAPEEFPRLFQAFEQTHAGRQLQEGTGLGLWIARQFVQLMNGTISVRSRGCSFTPDAPAPTPSPTETTTFTLVLPLKSLARADEASASPRRSLALAPHQPQYRLLVADDKDYNRQLLVQLLAPLGFALREARNGQEAIALWETWQPHLIWMDLRMPVMDGYEATRYIKTHPAGSTTAIIALSASTLAEELALTRAAGFDGCARKPFQTQEIFDQIARHLGVLYIYEEEKMTSERREADDASLFEGLKAMPLEWVRQFENAAAAIDDEQLFQLLEEIPSERALLIQTFRHWIRTFRCDKIVDCLEGYRSTFLDP